MVDQDVLLYECLRSVLPRQRLSRYFARARLKLHDAPRGRWTIGL